jgi:hypothetical protein
MLLHQASLNYKCSHEVFNPHDQLFSNYEPSTVASHLKLTRKRASVSPIKPWSDTRENALSNTASIVASLLKCVTSLLTRSRDHSSLLRHPSVHSWLPATNEARRCATRHGTAELGSAGRKHRFVYCCVLVGACFDVTVLIWRKYATLQWAHTL